MQSLNKGDGGSGEIRTHGGRKPSTVFKTVALNRSATLPGPDCIKAYSVWQVKNMPFYFKKPLAISYLR